MQNPQIAGAPQGSALTSREQEVLELLAFGLSNKEIAQRLLLSPRTVETHIDRILGKLNAPTRSRAVVEAGRTGLLRASIASGASSLEARPNNLPFQLTALVGREQDIVDVRELVLRNRLLTLSGSGGVGKTRLALRVGIDVVELNGDGVWFCDFSPIADPALVPSVVAKVLRLRDRADHSLAESILQGLKRKDLLLIFDNCEHVLDSAAELADEILHACPKVRILATSRQPLGIVGEAVHRLRSLAVPDAASGLTAHDAMEYGAVALFMDRAQAVDPLFALTNERVPIVATICRRLDGIPLAIELAAARVSSVSIEKLARSLDDRFSVLTAGSRTAWPRHKTLEALVDWSYDRLSEQEQQLFARLGVFAGGFSMDAVTAVCATNGLTDADVVSHIIALVEKSLLAVQTLRPQERYRLLETTRE